MPTTYEPIATTTLGTAQSSITFSSLGSYSDLVVAANYGTTSGGVTIDLRFNGDTGTNYSTTQLNGPGPFGSSWRASNQSAITVFGSPIVLSTPTTLTGTGTIHIQNYANTNTNKIVLARSGFAPDEVVEAVGLWRNTSAITSVTLRVGGSSMLAGSTFTIYGILAA